ncbi:sigma-70 family RNA polymerase sigma factor [Luteolibacter flavescens]|uniref:Sigma-70 family RNA polymerase sigma factor n=1 Tax=Luteolibacter flavescens TaxID=1859460 RepID=A0ABT3FUR0_9BACT|nr:sigma-70 family RNA polymerase sigma factor [Luteolibacter flavescens]MCW1887295.1 sigma-70 family RNA polymerase sigma factor [Luteolibacter flavescens]
MHAPSDTHLLASWLETDSEAGFRMIVERYAGLVYMTAKRTGADDAMAKEASQLTFITLARKASSLSRRDSLGGWLHVTSRMQVKNLLQLRKREANKLRNLGVYLNAGASPAPASTWRQIQPVLDQALGALSTRDRETILLRYYRSLSVREVAEVMAISVDAAQKRIDRAMERLRHQLSRHGVATSTSLGAVLLAGFASDAQAAALLAPGLATQALRAAPTAGASGIVGLILSFFQSPVAIVATILLFVAAVALFAPLPHDPSPQATAFAEPQRRRALGSTAFESSTRTVSSSSTAAVERRRLEATYGVEETALSQTLIEQTIQISRGTQSMLTEQILPAYERQGYLPLTAKMSPDLQLTIEQRQKLAALSFQKLRAIAASKLEALDRIAGNNLPAMEILLAGDACARGVMPVETYEALRRDFGPDLTALENPVNIDGSASPIQFGAENPCEDPAFVAGLATFLEPEQLENFVAATTGKLANRTESAVSGQRFFTFATMPPMKLDRISKQIGGSLLIVEGQSEMLQTLAQARQNLLRAD